MRGINITQLIHDLNFGGMQQVVVDLCLSIDHSKYNMNVCCLEALGPNTEALKEKGIPVFLIKKKPGIDYQLPFRLRRHFLKQETKLVHTHGINPFFYGTLGARLARVPVAIQTDHARGRFPVPKREMISEMILSRFVDRIIAVSEGVKSDLVKYEHISPKKIQVIYNVIDGSKYSISIDKGKKKKELGIPQEDKVIGVGVRLSRQKGIHDLITACGQAVRAFPKASLLIAGDGPLRHDLENLAASCGISRKVFFTGFRSDVPELLQVIDIYVLPSYWEGHPLVLLEAMAAGRAIVATNIPGNRETVDHAHTGLLVPPKSPEKLAKALLRLLQDDDLRNDMGKRGQSKFSDKYNIDRVIQQYRQLYDQLLK